MDEAIELADRVVVLDDGRIAADLATDLPKAGEARSARVAALRRQLLGYLGVEDVIGGPAEDAQPSRRPKDLIAAPA